MKWALNTVEPTSGERSECWLILHPDRDSQSVPVLGLTCTDVPFEILPFQPVLFFLVLFYLGTDEGTKGFKVTLERVVRGIKITIVV